MKFFTPEALDKYNSIDPCVASLANKEWALLEKEYCNHMHRLKHYFPKSVNKFYRKLCLCDAEILSFSTPTTYCIPQNIARIFAKTTDWAPGVTGDIIEKERLIMLEYVLADTPALNKYAEENQCITNVPLWLKDEFDITDTDGVFSHDILLSNGHTLTILFTRLNYIKSHVLAQIN